MFACRIIPGYDLTEVIDEGVNTVIYRGVWQQKQQSVILKVLKAYPSLDAVARLKYEYSNARGLNVANVVKVLGLETCANVMFLVFEDFGGVSLKHYLSTKGQLLLLDFMEIAIQLAQALSEVHAHHIVHKDIKPSNIIINPTSGIVKLTDFSIASLLETEIPQPINTNFIEGTLAYMSPEQTGRMNRSLDYRSDFYSLGVTFYEMLAGQLPFVSNNALELVHSHIAKQPIPIQTINPTIPLSIISIVMKLMAKNAEDRYQSSEGLKADLEFCLNQLKATGSIPDFTLGKRDISSTGKLLIPQKLYGREAEVATLLAAFERTKQGQSEIILVSGYSGIGKSSLVKEIYKPICQQGYFISGKFDQLKRDIPYASLIQAFQSLMQKLLTESSEKLQIWREKLLAALDNNGQIIIDVIPEVELIIGKQPEVQVLAATESQNRFNRVFQKFIRVFAANEHPLVIFLDDLQWSDTATLKLIQLLMSDRDSQFILLIGTYRDNEVTSSHPLIQTLSAIQECGQVIQNIFLKPLLLNHIEQLLQDMLANISNLELLAKLLFHKTSGNPFLLGEFLKTLHQEQLFIYDSIANCWSWSSESVNNIGITNLNAVELMVRNICKLPQETVNILKIAACIGALFKLNILATVTNKSITEVIKNLWLALQQGFIFPLSNEYQIPSLFAETELKNFQFDLRLEYCFAHDRIQEAAYCLISENEKKSTHLQIGRLILAATSSEDLDENIFVITNQMNLGINSDNELLEKPILAQLNLMAGCKAKKTAAYEVAAKYFNLGLHLLENDAWLNNYELALNLHIESAESEYLIGNFANSKKLCAVGISSAMTLVEKVKFYEIQIQISVATNQLIEAIEIGLEVLNSLNVNLLSTPPQVVDIEDCYNLPEMTDPKMLAAMQMMNRIAYPAYATNPQLYASLAFTMVQLSIQYGNSPLSAYGYVIYGLILCAILGEIEAGFRFGKLSIKLLDNGNANSLKPRVLYTFHGFIQIWKQNIRETIVPLYEQIQDNIQS